MHDFRISRRALLALSAFGLTACTPSPLISTPSLAPDSFISLQDPLLKAAGEWRALEDPFASAFADQLFYYAGFVTKTHPLDGRSGLRRGLIETAVDTADFVRAKTSLATVLEVIDEELTKTTSAERHSRTRLLASMLISLKATDNLVSTDFSSAGQSSILGNFLPWDDPTATADLTAISDSLYLLRKLLTAAIGISDANSELYRDAVASIDKELDFLTLKGTSTDLLPAGLPVDVRQSLDSDLLGTLRKYAIQPRELWIRACSTTKDLQSFGNDCALRWEVFSRRLGATSPYWPGWQQ